MATNGKAQITPPPTDELRSRIMKANRGKDTSPEIMLRKALYSNGLTGYRLYWMKVPGSPDIAYPGKKIAIFVNGCFWHRCPHCKPKLPRSNTDFWDKKFKANKERDKRKESLLIEMGWKVLVLWECEIETDVLWCVDEIRKMVRSS